VSKKLAGELAAAEAERLVRDLGITCLPVDPFKIAEQHGIMVVAKPASFEGVSGFLTKFGDNFVIAHASHIKNEGFIRFTVAHELGHYFLPDHPEKLFEGRDAVHHSKSGFIDDDFTELEADHFAAALLMPEEMFRNCMIDCGTGYPAVKEVSKRCLTSITATAIRFATFADDPVAVIVSSGRTIDYCFMSAALRNLKGIEWIRKGELLPPSSATSAFNGHTTNIADGNEDEAWGKLDDWFDGVPNLDVKEDVVGLGTYSKTLTVLHTDQCADDGEDDDYTSDDDD
jgi:Zn-dependent peptidase ImmA (M78 family)